METHVTPGRRPCLTTAPTTSGSSSHTFVDAISIKLFCLNSFVLCHVYSVHMFVYCF